MNKTFIIIIASIFISFFCYFSYIFIFLANETEKFCNDITIITPQITVTDITLKAEEQNYRVIDSKETNTLTVLDSRTMGKSTCHIDYSKAKLKFSYFGSK